MKRGRFAALGLRTLLLATLLAAAGLADVVYLKDGSRIEGNVRKSGLEVVIDTPAGEHRVDIGKVDHVEWGAPTGLSAVQKKPVLVRPTANAAVALALERKLDLDFVDTPLADVVAFLQNVTGANFVLDRRNLPQDAAPVTIKLSQVKLKEALRQMLEPLEMAYEVRDGLIFISLASKLRRYEVRVYDVRDLLVNFQDRTSSSRNLSLAAQTAGGSSSGGLQTSTTSNSDNESDNGTSGSEDLPSRVQSLALLIMQTVRPETWDRAAVRVIGGPSSNEGNTEESRY